jgi:hypothetical protein
MPDIQAQEVPRLLAVFVLEQGTNGRFFNSPDTLYISCQIFTPSRKNV